MSTKYETYTSKSYLESSGSIRTGPHFNPSMQLCVCVEKCRRRSLTRSDFSCHAWRWFTCTNVKSLVFCMQHSFRIGDDFS